MGFTLQSPCVHCNCSGEDSPLVLFERRCWLQHKANQSAAQLKTGVLPSHTDTQSTTKSRKCTLGGTGAARSARGGHGGRCSTWAPFEWIFYLYAPEVSFVGVESVRALLGDHMHPALKDTAFPAALRRQLRCDGAVASVLPAQGRARARAAKGRRRRQARGRGRRRRAWL